MSSIDHLGFSISIKQIRNGIFIPKYYNPEIQFRMKQLSKTHNLVPISELIREKVISVDPGDEIGKMSYGTGNIPFIRTSDISNWEIKTDPKQGVSEEIYRKYSQKQDVREGDIFFVRDGTYLIGQSCMVTGDDLPCLYQSHILKIRVINENKLNNYLLLSCLNSQIVKTQVRAFRFTADIIDTLGKRFSEIIIPIPKNERALSDIIEEAKKIVDGRVKLRETIRNIPSVAQQIVTENNQPPKSDAVFEEEKGNIGFKLLSSHIKNRIYIPKYYDPQLDADLEQLSNTHQLVSLGELVKRKKIKWNTGIEIGKMAYGTGDIPFIRTSDLSNWELINDPKQGVSEEIFEKNNQDVQSDDILIVRDGTYLVGVSCIITEFDTRILYCGGIYKLRSLDKENYNPYLLLTLLNTPIVKRQIRAKKFTRDIIDTLGKRLFEIIIPIPKDQKLKDMIGKKTQDTINSRVDFRRRVKNLSLNLEGTTIASRTDGIE